MAGAGYKLFNTGDVLTAAQVNTYLQEQTVMVFADAAARTTALSGVLAEGMISYLKDTNAVEKYDGSAWSAIGTGDIEGVTAGTGLTGGGTSGTVTLNFDVANYGGGTYAAGKNKFINGDFRINQRQFTSQTTDGYSFDRWSQIRIGGTVTASSQTFTPGTAPVSGYEGSTYFRMVTTGQSAVGDLAIFRQFIEGVRTFAGQTVTVSFWAQSGSATPSIAVDLYQYFGTGGSPSAAVEVAGQKTAISTSWNRYSFTFSVPSISGKTIGTNNDDFLAFRFWVSAGSTYNSQTNTLGIQSNTFNIWGVQVEAGSTATAFQTATGTVQGELAACQRYYWRLVDGTGQMFGVATFNAATQAETSTQFPVTMRITPTLVSTTGSGYYGLRRAAQGATSVLLFSGTPRTILVYSQGYSGLTAGQSDIFYSNNASASIAFDAEL